MTYDELTPASGDEEASPPQGENESPESIAPEDAIVDELATARAQAEDYLRHLQRVQADFINYKRRADQERAEFQRFAAAEVMKRLLPVLDDLDRAEAARPPMAAADPATSWTEGVVCIVRKLEDVLSAQGLSRIETVGSDFDPNLHEAVMQQEAPPEMADKVIAEAQRGYRLHDRVLRPAMVVVGRATEPASSVDEEQGPPPEPEAK